ncbi:MAG TPA: VWA domain-containing protein [Acidobacteriaceae bacterium]
MALTKSIVAGSLALLMTAAPGLTQQEAIPDAPRPQTNIKVGNVTPGQGSSSTSSTDTDSTEPAAPVATGPSTTIAATPNAPPATETAAQQQQDQAMLESFPTFIEHVDYVLIPFTVKDNKGRLVSGLQARDVQVFENGVRQPIRYFNRDAAPMSVALVIDQSMSSENMTRVNDALGALQGAFAASDEISVFTYNKATKLLTDYTGAQSPRLAQAVDRAKSSGREDYLAGSFSGPMAQTNNLNGVNVDPNTAPNRGHNGSFITIPKEVHPLNDAILEAAKSLSRKPPDRRRVIYVISNGNESGSKAKTSQVIKYLLTNSIEVDGTLVGDNGLPVMGFLDKIHLPLQMRDNVLVAYQKATGGQLDAEFRLASIEKSFERVANEARSRYTLGYYSPEPFIDAKERRVEVMVLHPNLQVIAKDRYWPEAMEMRTQPRPRQPQTQTQPAPQR